MSQRWTTIFVLMFLFIQIKGQETRPVVVTSVGSIRGVRATDGDYNMFLGIPYAKVDEANPFGNSQPYPNFEEVFEANDDSAFCPHVEEFSHTAAGTLDCLNVHVYVPDTANQTQPLPVLVWIYGGAFTVGFSGGYMHGAKYLVRHDIIFVSFNYRIGPYGFMCLDTPEVPGNQGLRDQVLALRWIKNNVEYFGGDPNDITVSGTSAGSMSIDLHLQSPHERLFNKVIMQSGHIVRSFMFRGADRQNPINIARQLGFTTDDFRVALDFLKDIDPITLINATFTIYNDQTYRPCIEQVFPGVDRFLEDYPMNVQIPNANGVKFMLGINKNEHLLVIYDRGPEFLQSENAFSDRLALTFEFDDERQLANLTNLVRRFYVGDAEMSQELLQQVADFDSDLAFNYPADRSIGRYLENGADEIYFYKFSYYGSRNFIQVRENVSLGTAVHGDEMGYQFTMEFLTDDPTPEDQLIIDRMSEMWTNFVKYGNPTPEISELLPVKWEPITTNSPYHFMEINSELSTGRRPFHDRFAFWELFYKTYANYERGYHRSSASTILLSPIWVTCILATYYFPGI